MLFVIASTSPDSQQVCKRKWTNNVIAKEPQATVAISNFAIRKPFIFLGEAQRRSNLNRKHWNRPVRFVWKNSLVGVLGFTKSARAKDW